MSIYHASLRYVAMHIAMLACSCYHMKEETEGTVVAKQLMAAVSCIRIVISFCNQMRSVGLWSFVPSNLYNVSDAYCMNILPLTCLLLIHGLTILHNAWSYTFMITSISHELSISDPKSSKMSAYLIRTSGVPLSYHHLQNVEKTKGLHVPLEYHYSTTIFHFDPYTIL